jgi:hypothetical protein
MAARIDRRIDGLSLSGLSLATGARQKNVPAAEAALAA